MEAMSSSREPLRLLRGGLAATVATAVALTGHVVAGGVAPAWLGVLVPWWLSIAVCTVLAGTRFTPVRMSAAVLGSQALFHGLFMAGTPGDPEVHLVDPPGRHLGHGSHHTGADALTRADLGTTPVGVHSAHGLGDLAQHGDHSSAAMLLGHLLAAVLTIVLLQRGESLVLGGIDLAMMLIEALLLPVLVLAASAQPVPGARAVGPVRATRDLRRSQQAVLEPQPRRGPPLALAA